MKNLDEKNSQITWRSNLRCLRKFRQWHGHCNVSSDDTRNRRLAQWVINIRQHKNKLPQWVKEQLVELNFDFNYKPSSWEFFYGKLVSYYQKYGHINVPSNYTYAELHDWIQRIRQAKDRLTKIQRRRLNELGFEWQTRTRWEEAWNKSFKSLTEFKNKYGHTIVPRSMKTLHGWCRMLRKQEERVNPEERKKLAGLGFRWSGDIEKANAQLWKERYNELAEFKKKHGHARVPTSMMRLYGWCSKIRNRKNRISSQQKKKLNKLGFLWDTKIANDEAWEIRYQELVDFKSKYGHIHVPQTMKKLHNWCHYIKKQKTYINPKRKHKLNKLGLIWAGDAENIKWEKRYQEFVEFKKRNGHTIIPASMTSLHLWCRGLRYKKSRISPERIKKLNKAGFRWTEDIQKEKTQTWKRKFHALEIFYQKHGHLSMPEKVMRNFVKYQKLTWDKMDTMRKEKLKMLGFPNRIKWSMS